MEKSQKMTSFFFFWNLFVINRKVAKAKLLFSGFICEHNVPIAIADHVRKLFQAMFPDSKIAEKYSCSLNKATQMLSGTVAKEYISDLNLTLI